MLNELKNISLAKLYREVINLPEHDPELVPVGMGLELLYRLFGGWWVSKKILSSENFSGASFSPLDDYKLQLKILTLSETLYNLRDIEGLGNILVELKNGNIDSIITELESGKLLFQKRLNFKYVTRTFKKGKDFDIHILNNEYEIFCDAKRKMDSTKYSVSSLQNSLHKAKKQMPNNLPTVILIKVPDKWGVHEGELREICASFVKKTTRPLGIICWYENWLNIDDIHAGGFMRGFEEHNEKSWIINSQILPIFPLNPQMVKWTSFGQFARGLL